MQQTGHLQRGGGSKFDGRTDRISASFSILSQIGTEVVHERLGDFVLVCTRFDMGRVDEQNVRFHETVLHGFLQDSRKDRFEDVRVPKPTHIILTEGREMRNGLGKVVADKPAVGDICYDFFDRLAHGANTKQLLDKHNFDENNGIYARTSRLRAVCILDEFVNEREVDGLFDLTNQMIFGDEFIQ